MELKQQELTIQDRIKNLGGISETRRYVFEKAKKEVPEGTSKTSYYAFKEAMYNALRGILSEKESYESLYKKANKLRKYEECSMIKEKIDSLNDEFDNLLEELGKKVEYVKNKREKMRILPNDQRLELMINGTDYSVLEIKFEFEERVA